MGKGDTCSVWKREGERNMYIMRERRGLVK